MNKQMTMSLISDELRQAATPKKELLERMDRIIPWSRWTELVQPYYYKGEHGNKPYPLERMLRIYVIQNLYNLTDWLCRQRALVKKTSFHENVESRCDCRKGLKWWAVVLRVIAEWLPGFFLYFFVGTLLTNRI